MEPFLKTLCRREPKLNKRSGMVLDRAFVVVTLSGFPALGNNGVVGATGPIGIIAKPGEGIVVFFFSASEVARST